MRYLNILFPLPDHLYIFQILEYEPAEFFKWFIRFPFKRNLQKKHRLNPTLKVILLFSISLFLMIASAVFLNLFFLRGFDLPVIILLILYFQLFSPIFLLLSQLMLWPFEIYLKRKMIKAAQIKLEGCKNLKVVAITGSFAKTSTKNMLYTLLWKKYRVVKTPKSYNNPLSIAQTILEDVKENTEVLIVEIGAYRIGEIAKVVSWLKPEIGVITGIAPQHLERFGSLENIARAKFELVEGLPKNGIAILNGESELLVKLAKKMNYSAVNCGVSLRESSFRTIHPRSRAARYSGPKIKHQVIFFGKPGNYIYASDIKVTPKGTTFTSHANHNLTSITIPLIGTHHVQNFLAASLVALELKLSLEDIKNRAPKLLPTPHRLEITNKRNMIIIDNSYNTNPDSAKISFKLLKGNPGKQKIIITPGLIELGSESSAKNQEFANNASKIADEIIIVGESNKKDLLGGLKNAKFPKEKTHHAKTLQEGMKLLEKISKIGSVILIENDLPDQYF